MLDRFECYELCVQSPADVCEFLRALHGGEPIVLREDFCGTAAVGARWVLDGAERGGRAVCVDIDAEALDRARERVARELPAPLRGRVELVRRDCTQAGSPSGDAPGGGADVIFVGNFSVGYLRTRAELVRYLWVSRERCERGGRARGGVFVCDTYGGAGAFKLGGVVRKHPGPSGETVHYTWVHEEADARTGMVVNTVSFRVEKDGEVVAEWPRAFEYRWRLWSIAEVRDAMEEAGFVRTGVYADVSLSDGQAAREAGAAELGEDWTVLVAGFT